MAKTKGEGEGVMRRFRVLPRLTGVACIAMLAGCTTSKINTSDSTPPTAEIKVLINGSYQAMSDVNQSNQPIEIMGIVSDPDGVRSADLEFPSAPRRAARHKEV